MVRKHFLAADLRLRPASGDELAWNRHRPDWAHHHAPPGGPVPAGQAARRPRGPANRRRESIRNTNRQSWGLKLPADTIVSFLFCHVQDRSSVLLRRISRRRSDQPTASRASPFLGGEGRAAGWLAQSFEGPVFRLRNLLKCCWGKDFKGKTVVFLLQLDY